MATPKCQGSMLYHTQIINYWRRRISAAESAVWRQPPFSKTSLKRLLLLKAHFADPKRKIKAPEIALIWLRLKNLVLQRAAETRDHFKIDGTSHTWMLWLWKVLAALNREILVQVSWLRQLIIPVIQALCPILVKSMSFCRVETIPIWRLFNQMMKKKWRVSPQVRHHLVKAVPVVTLLQGWRKAHLK